MEIDNARKRIAKSLNCKPSEIYFTSGGSEGDNLAIKGILFANNSSKNTIVTSKIEHPAVLNTFKELETLGYNTEYLNVSEYGFVDFTQLKNILSTNQVQLVSIMLVNNELGSIQDMSSISKYIKAKHNDCFLHIDAVQAVGKVKLNLNKLKCDALTISGHKFGAPKGIGILYIRDGVEFSPIINGGGQENGKRGGTENVAGIIGIAKALEIANVEKSINKKNDFLKKETYLINNLLDIDGSHLNSPSVFKATGIINVRFDNIEAQALVRYLDNYYICISAGSACHSNSDTPSHVLKAIGLNDKDALSSIRISFNDDITIDDLDYLLKYIKEGVSFLRKF